MKHILIPTDFTVASLQPIHAVVKCYCPDNQLKISLLHLLESPSGIQDLLTKPANGILKKIVTEEFKTACQVLQTKYSSGIADIDIMIKYGTTASYLRNLLEGHKIDALWIAESFTFKRPSKQSVDIYRLVKKLRFPVNRAPVTGFSVMGNSLSELLVEDEVLEVNYKMV